MNLSTDAFCRCSDHTKEEEKGAQARSTRVYISSSQTCELYKHREL